MGYVTNFNVSLFFPLVSFVCVYYQLQPPLYCAIMILPVIITALGRFPKIRLFVSFLVVAVDLKILGDFPSAFLMSFPIVFSLVPREYLSVNFGPIPYLSRGNLACVGGIFWCYLSHQWSITVWSCGFLLSHIFWIPFGLAYTNFMARGKMDSFVGSDGNLKRAKKNDKKEDPAILYSPNARGGIQVIERSPDRIPPGAFFSGTWWRPRNIRWWWRRYCPWLLWVKRWRVIFSRDRNFSRMYNRHSESCSNCPSRSCIDAREKTKFTEVQLSAEKLQIKIPSLRCYIFDHEDLC